MAARSPEERPERQDEPTEAEGELHRLWSPQQLEELRDSKRRYAAGRRLAALASDVMSKRITDETIVRRLRQLADWYEGKGETGSKPKAEQAPLIDDVRTVFDHWVKVSGSKKAKLKEERRKLIKKRLKDFTAEELCRVIDYAAQDEFWGGEKTSTGRPVGLEGILRKYGNVEGLRDAADADGQQMLFAGAPELDAEIEELEKEARRLSQEGRVEDANAIQRAIRRRFGTGE